LISNPRDNHRFGQLNERQFLWSCHKWNAFVNVSPLGGRNLLKISAPLPLLQIYQMRPF